MANSCAAGARSQKQRARPNAPRKEAADDYVGADNPVRFIDAFADELDLAAARLVRAEVKATGLPDYASADHCRLALLRRRDVRDAERRAGISQSLSDLSNSIKPTYTYNNRMNCTSTPIGNRVNTNCY